MVRTLMAALLAAVVSLPLAAGNALAADAKRQAEVAQRGADVMPFSLAATTHVFRGERTFRADWCAFG